MRLDSVLASMSKHQQTCSRPGVQSGPCIAAIQPIRNCLCNRYAVPFPTVANSSFLLSPPLARPAVSWAHRALQLNRHSRFSNFQTYGITHELESSGPTTCEEPDDSLRSDQPLSTRSDANAPTTNTKRRPKQRMRLDEYCLLLAPQYSRNVIQSFILQGKVRVGDKVVTKAGTPVVVGAAQVVIDTEVPKYVCRAGLKLEKALSHWGIDVRGLTALDSGQSTGGFTDCLLQHGAAKVYGIDVGHSQLSEKIRRDERVVVMEKFNLRHLESRHLPEQVDIATLDLSFISVLLVVGPVSRVLRPDGGQLVVLIKPQFEAGRKQVSAGGVVRDPKVHAEVVSRVTSGIIAHGFELVGVTESPIKGDKSGNTEFLAYFRRRPELAAGEAASVAMATAEAQQQQQQEEGGAGAE